MAAWQFLPNPGREEEGLGHAGIETFKGSPYPSIARESSQNSLDAAARAADGTHRPVHLAFRLLNIPAAEIPGLSGLKGTLSRCLQQARLRGLKKDIAFFERAIAVSDQADIPVLLIEDFGTTGLGKPGEGGPFHALVKSSGVSQKSDADAGGSFGIGKNAAFAISSLRTVFYSTLYSTLGNLEHVVQGKSILVSHEHDHEPKRATGYWGDSDFSPVLGTDQVPSWLRRSDVGTTVASVGFVDEPDWQWQMVESLVRNFFSAINKGAVRFTVAWADAAAVEIDAASLEGLFSRDEVQRAAENAGTMDELAFSSAMLAALNAADTELLEETFADAGAFRLRILQAQSFPRRVGILRNGMYIADNLRHFGHPFVRFPLSRDFVAILEPSDPETSSRIRDMESPRHDEVSAERIDDFALRRKVKLAIKKVGAWVRDAIKASTTKASDAEVLLDEMNRFFSKPGSLDAIPDPSSLETNPELITVTPREVEAKPPMGSGPSGASGSAGGKKPGTGGNGRTSGERGGKGRGSAGGRGGKQIRYAGLRNSVMEGGAGARRRVAFTPAATGSVQLEISAVGVSSDEALAIQAVNGTPSAKSPVIHVQEGARLSLDIEFDTPYVGPISIVLSAVEGSGDAS